MSAPPAPGDAPELPVFPSARGLPDQPKAFFDKALTFLTWMVSFRAWLIALTSYLEGLSIGGGSTGKIILPLTDGQIPPGLMTDDAGNLIWIEVENVD